MCVFSCGQQEILYDVPQLKILKQSNHRQTSFYILWSTLFLKSFSHRPFQKFPRHCREHTRCNVPDAASKKPPVCPEKGTVSIAHMRDQGNRKECHRIGMNQDFKSCPGSVFVNHSQRICSAQLMYSRLRTPSPPRSSGRCTFFHATKQLPPLICLRPFHKYALRSLSTALINYLGTLMAMST